MVAEGFSAFISTLRARVETLGVHLELGAPCSPSEVDTLAAKLRVVFPAAYRRFLTEVGGLRLWDDRDGHLDELAFLGLESVEAAQDELRREFEACGVAPIPAAVIMRTQGPLSSCTLLDGAGRVVELHRGALQPTGRDFDDFFQTTLTETVASWEPSGLKAKAKASTASLFERMEELSKLSLDEDGEDSGAGS